MNDRREERISIGVLGCSDIALRRFLPAAVRAHNARLVALASRDIGTARRLSPLPSCIPMLYTEMLKSEEIQLVYISLPNHLHEEWTVKALEHGKHVICEKPLGLDPGSVERVACAAERRRLLLYENIMYLHHPQHQKVRELLAAGAIGTVRGLRAAFGFRLERKGFRLDAGQGGGAFHDLARYPLSAALHFLRGETSRFTGYAFMRGGLNVGMSACARTSADELLSFSIGFEQQYECWYELLGDRGTLRLDRAFTTPADHVGCIRLFTSTEAASMPVPAADHFQLMIEHVCGLVRQGRGYAAASGRARQLARMAEQAFSGCDPMILPEKERRSWQ